LPPEELRMGWQYIAGHTEFQTRPLRILIGAIPCMSMVNNRLFYKLFSSEFPFDKLDYGMFLRPEDMKIK
jgi:hypothetical protein